MTNCLPIPKIDRKKDGTAGPFCYIELNVDDVKSVSFDCAEVFRKKMWNYQAFLNTAEQTTAMSLILHDSMPQEDSTENEDLFKKQGYVLDINSECINLYFETLQGFVNGLSTFKQLPEKDKDDNYNVLCRYIVDWPSVEIRSVSNTFAWYAGYGRIGFDMQLWGYDEWIEYLNICSDFKINQFNMCMYGYWPFDFPEYPETMLKDLSVPVWNKESSNWITVNYTHPNIAEEFLSRLIEYGHSLGIDFFAYIGLNSYNGGFSNEHMEKRMKLPPQSKFINDFDTLCPSNPENVAYLETAIRKIIRLGFDGLDFEESEEAFWFCNCENCRNRYGDVTQGPAEAKHKANYELLQRLYKAAKEENPSCIVGLRAWREPPLVKEPEYIKEMTANIPDDVILFWSPGLYTSENEFKKWANAFGSERIWGRDTESNAVSACFGRLIRILRRNGLRCEEENNDQFLEEDIKQHIGSVALGVKGINGYMFEWYGFFLHLFVHSFFGWGSCMEPEDFYRYALDSVFGEENGKLLYHFFSNMLTIHESQLPIFPTEFPFARNKVGKQDVPLILKAKDQWESLYLSLKKVLEDISGDEQLSVYGNHIRKLMVAHERNAVIYALALASIEYENAETPEDRKKWLKEMYQQNEKNFEIVKDNYFDIYPVSKSGKKSCMIPYHELKRVILNRLYPEMEDPEPIYLGVEALGWLWL